MNSNYERNKSGSKLLLLIVNIVNAQNTDLNWTEKHSKQNSNFLQNRTSMISRGISTTQKRIDKDNLRKG